MTEEECNIIVHAPAHNLWPEVRCNLYASKMREAIAILAISFWLCDQPVVIWERV